MLGVDTIIWDWNGTLLNDLDICIDAINVLLNDRQLPLLSKERYLELFDFPVIDYYRRIGFDFSKEPFNVPAQQYIGQYISMFEGCNLHANVPEVLSFFRAKGFSQMVLSAAEHQKLVDSIDRFGILEFFNAVSGLDNDFATSKTDLGIELFRNQQLIPSQVCLIGDTTHDFEVAEALGCKSILVADGHQNKKRLSETGAVVVDKLYDLFEIFGKLN